MRNIQTKVAKKIKTHSLCSVNFSSENRAVKNMAEPDRPLMTVLYGACALHAG